MTAPKYVGTRIYYTADVYTPDPPCPFGPPSDVCECTNICGEPTEHGYGETEDSGWIDLRWSATQVHEKQEDVEPDYPFGTVWDFDPEDVAAAIVHDVLNEHYNRDHLLRTAFRIDPGVYDPKPSYIEEYIEGRIGATDYDDGRTYYASDDYIENYYTGVRARLAAHIYDPGED